MPAAARIAVVTGPALPAPSWGGSSGAAISTSSEGGASGDGSGSGGSVVSGLGSGSGRGGGAVLRDLLEKGKEISHNHFLFHPSGYAPAG